MGFEATAGSRYRLSYTVGGDQRSVAYEIKADATYAFEFDDGRCGKRQETYRAGAGGGGGRGEGRPPRGEGGAQGGGPRRRPPPGQGGNGGGQTDAPKLPDQPRSSDGTFLLTSPAVEDGAELPVEFTGDGDGMTPPLAWKGAPANTKEYALLMDHADPEGNMKWYWTLYRIPAAAKSLEKGDHTIGTMGTGFKGQVGYEAPHSPGAR